MYLNVFELYLLLHGSILLCEASEKPTGAKEYYEAMWQKDGGGRNKENTGVPPLPQRIVPLDESDLPTQNRNRLKRDDFIDPSLYAKKWVPEDFFGVRSNSIIGIVNIGHYPFEQTREYSYGVRVQTNLVLTLCSVVTYVEKSEDYVTAWVHTTKRVPVTKCKPTDLSMYVMKVEPDVKLTAAKQILIHPGCDSWYDTDVAVVVSDKPFASSRNVWIHTAENLIFRRTLDRVVAAQAVLGKCSVPVYTQKIAPGSRKIELVVDYVPIHFQHWSGCRANVCPYWGRGPRYPRKQDFNRCQNFLNGTRYCMVWSLPDSLCGLSPGTPVFCDIGSIHGLMGFIANETYLCTQFFDKSAIMVGLVDAIGWIRDTLQVRLSKDYEESIPQWMINLRENYTSHVVPRIKPLTTTTPSPSVVFADFIGHQTQSIVNVYYENDFRCRGTLVTKLIVIVPCSCIARHAFNLSIPDNIRFPNYHINVDDISKLRVSLMINGSVPNVKVYNFKVGEGCDTHFTYDYALLHLSSTLPSSKIAWMMTAHENVFRNMLKILPISDSAMGNKCFWMENNSPSDRSVPSHKIRFVHWTRCMSVVCPTIDWLHLQQVRCFGSDSRGVVSDDTRYCVESSQKNYPACDLPSGTPVFCNVEQARGFVGFISKGIDMNPTPCKDRAPANQTAVFMGLDKILPAFSDSLWINDMEMYFRDNTFARSYSPQLIPSSDFIYGILTSFLILNK